MFTKNDNRSTFLRKQDVDFRSLTRTKHEVASIDVRNCYGYCSYECSGNSSVYNCLYNTKNKTYTEFCEKNEEARAGLKYVISGTYRNVKCSEERYQPFTFWTNRSTYCLYLKSPCSETGQLVFDNTSTIGDSTCRCDYTRHYAFLSLPRNPCFCKPSVEDCSCYIKQCPNNTTLSPDYECRNLNSTEKSFNCNPVIHTRTNGSDIDTLPNGTEQFQPQIKTLRTTLAVKIVCICIIAGITKCYKETATNTLGFKERGQKPWISNESWKLVDERRQLKERTNNSRSERVKNNLHAKYSDKDKEVKKSMRNDKRQWTDNLIEEAEKAASNGMMKTVYEVTRTICNEKQKPPQVIKDKSGNPLSSHDEPGAPQGAALYDCRGRTLNSWGKYGQNIQA
ncbi:unnamed protein product [Mytilus edulis]|uniref:Uncharacterized protein n=1 Tax=Mytilus edulis TaxID=6550 RepID=A0A8S3RVU9_MYTED|nr:unnamed protein product [Mytilus edulis]